MVTAVDGPDWLRVSLAVDILAHRADVDDLPAVLGGLGSAPVEGERLPDGGDLHELVGPHWSRTIPFRSDHPV